MLQQLRPGEGWLWRWWATLAYQIAGVVAIGLLLARGWWPLAVAFGAVALGLRLLYGWPPFGRSLGLLGLWGATGAVLLVVFLGFAGYAIFGP